VVVDRKGVRVMDWFRVRGGLRVRVTARIRDSRRVRAREDKGKVDETRVGEQRQKTSPKT
jgi:hypothetical protein